MILDLCYCQYLITYINLVETDKTESCFYLSKYIVQNPACILYIFAKTVLTPYSLCT